jgi:hypothetical protein
VDEGGAVAVGDPVALGDDGGVAGTVDAVGEPAACGTGDGEPVVCGAGDGEGEADGAGITYSAKTTGRFAASLSSEAVP